MPATLLILSAPSGTGKTTLARRLVAAHPGAIFSVSYTTRPPRGAERDGVLSALVGPGGKTDGGRYRTALLAACLVGEDGVALFAPEEVSALSAKSAVALDRLFVVAERLNDAGQVGDRRQLELSTPAVDVSEVAADVAGKGSD